MGLTKLTKTEAREKFHKEGSEVKIHANVRAHDLFSPTEMSTLRTSSYPEIILHVPSQKIMAWYYDKE